MRPEIDLDVMQEIGEIARVRLAAVDVLSFELNALLEALRASAPSD